MPRRQPAPKPKGRIITFYSYKGGTGRSMAVANVAWILALSGHRVLVIDWDLEAPGIHRYFHPFLSDKELQNTEGLLDFVEKSAGRAACADRPLDKDEIDIVEYITLLRWPATTSLSWQSFGPQAGIDLIIAGRQGPGYSAKLNGFNWIEFYEKLGGRHTMEVAREQFQGLYDYVLIDSRTGVSDTSGICTVEMPDSVVVCFTLNDQSILGASGVAESITSQRHARATGASADANPNGAPPARPDELPFRIFPVPMRVEIFSESAKRQLGLGLAQQKFNPFLEHLRPEIRSRYWGRVQLPYFPVYAFEEIPAVFGDPANEELSLTTPLKQIARFIIDDPELELKPLDSDDTEAERLRKMVLGWYLRTGSSPLDAPQLAKTTYDQLDVAKRGQMRKVLQRLVQVRAGLVPVATTRLLNDFEEPLLDMVRRLTSAGVLETSNRTVAIADKKVAEDWDLLREWVKADEAFLIWRQDLSAAAEAWDRAARDESRMLRGIVLDQALDWFKNRRSDLNTLESEYITASRAHRDQTWKVNIGSVSLGPTELVAAAGALLALLLAGYSVMK